MEGGRLRRIGLFSGVEMTSTKGVRSFIWNYFILLDKGKGKCRICLETYSYSRGSTSNLKRHLKLKHGKSYALGVTPPSTPLLAPHKIEREPGHANVSEATSSQYDAAATTASTPTRTEAFPFPAVARSSSGINYDIVSKSESESESKSKSESESESESEPETKAEIKHSPLEFTIEAERTTDSEREEEEPAAPEAPEDPPNRPLTSEKVDLLNQWLLKVLCMDGVPFDLVDSENFKTFVLMLNPTYTLPAKKEMSKVVLASAYGEAVEVVKERLATASSIALTCERWSSVEGTHYVCLSGHFIDDQFKLCSNLLECVEVEDAPSGKHTVARVRATIERYKLGEKVVAIVTDSPVDGMVAVNELKMSHVTCFAHTLNLIVENAISDSIKGTVDEVRRIVQHLISIPEGAETLRATQHRLYQTEVKLKLDTPASCNSTYDMLNRFLQNKISLLACLDMLGIHMSLGNVHWDIIEQALTALRYFNSAANVISAERNVVISHVGLLSGVLLQKTANLSKNPLILDEVQFFVSLLTQGLQERLEDFLSSDLVAKAMLLDPRIKKLGFQNGLMNYREAYDAIVLDLIPLQAPCTDELQSATTGVANEDVDVLFGDVLEAHVARRDETPRQAAVDELERYLNMNNIELDKDPLVWWKLHHAKFPSLFALAKGILCIPGTTAPADRLFSKAGQRYREKRARLAPKHLKQILFVQQNITR
uniref:BED-type domain-containing protein n=1 Tax=Anopheles farauti TaxID=69004 RepID=A0A182QDP1_9DIPT